MNGSYPKLIIVFTAFLLLTTSICGAYTIAIFPVANLNQGRNGVDLELTEKLAEQLRSKQFTTISSEKVMSFMVEHGVRHCGEIDTLTCRIMAKELKCDTVMVTTVLDDLDSISSSLTITLYDGKTGKSRLSKVLSYHIDDKQPFLGLGKINSFNQLQQILIADVGEFLQQNPITFSQNDKQPIRNYQVSDIKITPQLVRGESDLKCRLKMRFIGEEPEYIQISSGEITTILRRSKIAQTYEGTLRAHATEGEHPVDLHLHWCNDQQELVSNLTHYQVANNPSQLELRICSGLNLGEIYAFSDRVKLLPAMTPSRPIDCWQFTITDENGKVVMIEKHHTPLPEQLQWRGTDNNRRRLDVGRYEMGLEVWDIAGNLAATSSTLYLQPKEIDLVTINQQFNNDRHQLELLPAENTIIPIDHWAITLETDQGEIVYTTQGHKLPALVTLPASLNYDQLSCTVKVLDKLGNNTLLSGTRFQVDGSSEMLAQRQNSLNWSADF